MSWKGFQKAAGRAPQAFKQRFNMGDITKDAVYMDTERRFQELETETTKLHGESKKYFEAINGMLDAQIEFSKACAEIYKPISGRVSDPDSAIPEGNPEGIEACEQYESIVRDLQATLRPELEMIETRVIRPAVELMEIIKVVRKSTKKRDHKQLDYDRHRATLKKLQDKKEKDLKDEKALYRAENDVEQATQEFNYFNDLLKEELPRLFMLEREFIVPLFQSFYYMQLNVFYTLHEKMQSIDIGYFDLTTDIEEAFTLKQGDVRERVEALTMVHFKTTGSKRPPVVQRYGARPGAVDSSPRPLAIEAAKTSSPSHSSRVSTSEASELAPPSYAASNGHIAVGSATPLATYSMGSMALGKPKPVPPAKPKPSRLSGIPAPETVTALYDYEAQAAGDLSFSQGDVIEIVQRTQSENEWWTGRVGGREGQFPGNYVQLNS